MLGISRIGVGRSIAGSIAAVIATVSISVAPPSRSQAQITPPPPGWQPTGTPIGKPIDDLPVVLVGPPPESAGLAPTSTLRFTVQAVGHRSTELFKYFNLDKLCQTRQFKMTIISPPMHGTMSIQDSQLDNQPLLNDVFSKSFNGGPDSRTACKSSGVGASSITYQPEADHVGVDRAVIEIEDMHTTRKVDFLIVTP